MARRVIAADPSFGDRLRELRTRRGMSMQDFGAISRTYIWDIWELETGRRRPTPEIAALSPPASRTRQPPPRRRRSGRAGSYRRANGALWKLLPPLRIVGCRRLGSCARPTKRCGAGRSRRHAWHWTQAPPTPSRLPAKLCGGVKVGEVVRI